MNRDYKRYAIYYQKWIFWTDAEYIVSVFEDDEFVDFHDRIIWPEDWDKITIGETNGNNKNIHDRQ